MTRLGGLKSQIIGPGATIGKYIVQNFPLRKCAKKAAKGEFLGHMGEVKTIIRIITNLASGGGHLEPLSAWFNYLRSTVGRPYTLPIFET